MTDDLERTVLDYLAAVARGDRAAAWLLLSDEARDWYRYSAPEGIKPADHHFEDITRAWPSTIDAAREGRAVLYNTTISDDGMSGETIVVANPEPVDDEQTIAGLLTRIGCRRTGPGWGVG
ncbi:MAG: hypothetical protein ACK5CE_17205 [Actinomycetes bacterium]|jgi:hypothetical protein